MKMNPLLLSDGYKHGHPNLYPSDMEYLYSNTTPRSSRIEGVNEIVVFGISYFVQEYLINAWADFFKTPVEDIISEYREILDNYIGPEVVNEDKIRYLHSLGHLPIHLKALPEGTICPIGVPLMTITNTDPKCGWLTNFLETISQTILWRPMTSATIARRYKTLLSNYADKTSDMPKDFVNFQAHDFSMRGMDSLEAACTSGGAHLTSFWGTDSVPAIKFLMNYYGADPTKEMVGASVTATEHSIQCTYKIQGVDNEHAYIQAMLDKCPKGIVSIVADGYDFFKFISEDLIYFKNRIMARDGKVVVRPDCYDEKTEILTNNGWKFFNDLKDDDLVAQVLDNGAREFVKPTKIIKIDYEGDMHHFQDFHGKVDLLVTPNHRMVLIQDGKEKIVEASKLQRYGNHNQKMIRSASSPSDPNIHLSYLERLRIAFQADGSFKTGCNADKIRFSFSKQRKVDRLKEILNYLNLSYQIYQLTDGSQEFSITLNVNDFQKDFEWVDESKLTKEWCQEFIEECSYWDSCRRSDDRFKFDTTVLSIADKVESIALGAGYGVLKSFYEDNRSEKFSDLITLHILKDNTVGGKSWENKKVYYSGKVYCVTVPTGKLFVRRNRCTIVCGNSGNPVNIICGYSVVNTSFTFDDVVQKTKSQSGHMRIWNDNECLRTADGRYITKDGEISELESLGAIRILYKIFGGSVNSKGYIELDPHIGLIYGDSITYERCEKICDTLARMGFASTNCVYGIGSYTYTYNTRDTFGFACKATANVINGKVNAIFKKPATDKVGLKKSAQGYLQVHRENGKLVLHNNCENDSGGELKTVFKDGKIYTNPFLAEIRERVKNG